MPAARSGSRKLRALPHRHLIHAIRTMLAGEDSADARQRLSERCNDDAHLRRLDPIDLPPAVTEAFTDLTLLIERSRFLADFPLWHVTDAHRDDLAKTAQVHYRKLMETIPSCPQNRCLLAEQPGTRQSLSQGRRA